MEAVLILLGVTIIVAAVYRFIRQTLGGPQATVRNLLRQYHRFATSGLPEQESLMRVLLRRRGWNKLPPAFLAELVGRLQSKENVFRFVSLSEGYKFDRRQLPAIAADRDVAAAMRKVAGWLGDFGMDLEKQGRLKEAEFVQKLAFTLEPDQSFTALPLAATYYKMQRYEDAIPLFRDGLARLDSGLTGRAPHETGPLMIVQELKGVYEEMYAACLRATQKSSSAAGR